MQGASKDNTDTNNSLVSLQKTSKAIDGAAIPDEAFDSEDDSTSCGSTMGKLDRLSRLRRERRLAMNRESARNRRKRKKVRLSALEEQVTDLVRKVQQCQAANESLTAKNRALEAELTMARTTIAQLTSGGGAAVSAAAASAATAANTAAAAAAAQQARFAAAATTPRMPTLCGTAHTGTTTDFTGATTDSAIPRDNLGRLMKAQLEQLALQGGTSTGIPFAAPTQFADDPILRHHALDIHALSQASRDCALGSMVSHRFGRGGGGGLGGAPGSPVGRTEGMQNTEMRLGDARIGADLAGAQVGLRLQDALTQSQAAGGAAAGMMNQQQMLEELLRQRNNVSQSPKYPPPAAR